MLRKTPGFTAVAVLTLALGIGANTAIFSVVNKVLLQPLPFPHADRIVSLERSYPQWGNQPETSIPKFMVWREQTGVFQATAAYDPFGGPGINITGGDRPQQVRGIHASAGYFQVFGVPIMMGRAYSTDEDRPGGPHVVVISSGLWRGRFGGDPAIIGKTIALGGDPYQVIGIVGPSFAPDPPVDLWLPLQADPSSRDQGNFMMVAGSLRPGVSLDRAKAAMRVAAEEFRRKEPGPWMDPSETATVEPYRDTLVTHVRPALLILLTAVGFVLLLACANVANLLLARAIIRKREIAIRAALGAGRGRVIRQLLTESLMLSLAGGLGGLALGFIGIRALLALYPNNVSPLGGGVYIPLIGSRGSAVAMDWRILLFVIAVSLITALLFGILPALHASRTDLSIALNEGSGRAATYRHNKARSVLVISEIAMAAILLAGAALLIRTLAALQSVKPGFDAHNVLTMQMSLTGARFEKTAALAQAVREAEQRLGPLPGIESVALTCCLPLEGGPDLPFTIEGRRPASGPYNGDDEWRFVSPGFFDVFRIPLLRGRTFNDSDDSASAPVVVISEAMARRYWPKDNPVGTRITIGHGLGPEFEEPPRQIIGVVSDVRDQGLGSNPHPMMYVPVAQLNDGLMAMNSRITPVTWAVRTKVPPFSISEEIQKELRIATGGLPVANIRSMEQVVAGTTAWSEFNGTLFSVFAGVALFLATIGIYGLMAYSVQQRTHEIGIRMALGASRRNVGNMILAEGATLMLIGMVVGVSAALALTRMMTSLLYGVKPWDPIAFGAVVILLGLVALLACYVPARRAMRVDPMVALRHE